MLRLLPSAHPRSQVPLETTPSVGVSGALLNWVWLHVEAGIFPASPPSGMAAVFPWPHGVGYRSGPWKATGNLLPNPDCVVEGTETRTPSRAAGLGEGPGLRLREPVARRASALHLGLWEG